MSREQRLEAALRNAHAFIRWNVVPVPGSLLSDKKRATLQAIAAVLGEQEATPECTGLAATWCPVHGDCTCRPYGPGVADHKDDPTCPLHAPSSPHGEPVGEQEAAPPEASDVCPRCGCTKREMYREGCRRQDGPPHPWHRGIAVEAERGDVERWPGTTERPWFVEGLTAMDRFRSRVILCVGDSDQDRADLAMIVEAVNAYAASAPQGEPEPDDA